MKSRVQFNKLLQSLQCASALDALAGNGHALVDALLGIDNLNGKGRIGNHHLFMVNLASVAEHIVKHFGSLLFGFAALQVLGVGNVQLDVGWFEQLFVFVGGYLEVARQRYFIVAVNAGLDAVVNANLLINALVETHLVEVGHTQQLALRL